MASPKSSIDIAVKVTAPNKSLRGSLKFTYSAKGAHVEANGDIYLPADGVEVTLRFHLETQYIVVVGAAGRERLPVSFDPGSGRSGKDALAIWREGDARQRFPSLVFSGPALSTSADGRANAVVATTDANQEREIFEYSIAVVVQRRNGRQFRKVHDPRIKNGGIGAD